MTEKSHTNRLPLILQGTRVFPAELWHALDERLQQRLIAEMMQEKLLAKWRYKHLEKEANAETERHLRT